MPIYTYRNPKTKKTIEVIQSMTDKHEFTDSEGVVYERVFEHLNLSSDESIDAFSEKDFADKTRKKNYNLGEMWDVSNQLSEKRKSIMGKDNVKDNVKEKNNKRI